MRLSEQYSHQKTSRIKLLLCLLPLAVLFTLAACKPGPETQVSMPDSDLPALEAVNAVPETSPKPINSDTPLPTVALTIVPNAAAQLPIVVHTG